MGSPATRISKSDLVRRARAIQRPHSLDDIFGVDALQFRSGHFAEVAEAADDRLQVGDLHAQCLRALAKDFLELLGGQLAGTRQVLHRELQGEQRVLEFVRQAPGKLAPRGDAFGLDKAVALAGQLAGHMIEAARQHTELIAALFGNLHIPVAGGHVPGGASQLLDGPRYPRRDPQAQADGEQNSDGCNAI